MAGCAVERETATLLLSSLSAALCDKSEGQERSPRLNACSYTTYATHMPLLQHTPNGSNLPVPTDDGQALHPGVIEEVYLTSMEKVSLAEAWCGLP